MVCRVSCRLSVVPDQALTDGVSHEEEAQDAVGKKRKRQTGSFFSWFEEALSREQDLEIAEIIKEQIWPNPLEFFREEV